jgi:hypothetical protein
MSQLKGKIPEGVKAVSAIKVRLLISSPLPLELALTGHGVSPQRFGQGVDVKGADIHIFADVIEKELGVRCDPLLLFRTAFAVAVDSG